MMQETLQLRDIKLPPEPGYWPLAPGWWVLIGLGVVLLGVVLWLAWRRYRRYQQFKHDSTELGRVHHSYLSHKNQHQLASEVSDLLRRFVRFRMRQGSKAALQGNQWLEFLNESAAGTDFSSAAKALIEGPFDPQVQYDADRLITAVRAYFKYNSMQRRHHA